MTLQTLFKGIAGVCGVVEREKKVLGGEQKYKYEKSTAALKSVCLLFVLLLLKVK